MTLRTRQGKHGTQWLYRIHYIDSSEDGPTWTNTRWAYSEDQCRDEFVDVNDPDWTIVKIDRVRE